MTTPVDTARAAVSDALADLHAARTCCQRAEEASAAALRASEALTRAQFATVPGGVS